MALQAIGWGWLLATAALAAIAVSPPAAHAAAAEAPATRPLPAGGVSVLPADVLETARLSGKPDESKLEVVAVSGQPFEKAVRLSTLKQPRVSYEIQVVLPTVAGVKRGDALLATFHVRRERSSRESGEAELEFIFEQAGEPFNKSAETPVSAGPAWEKIQIPFMAVGDYAAGKAQVCFRVGFAPQVIDLGGLQITNYGKSISVKDLPRTRFGYAGMEPDAPWRKAAAERIDKIRKGDLTVVVTDGAGRPLADAAVAVRMKRHAFGFGSAVTAWALTAKDSTGDRYRQIVDSHFSKVVLENDLKWGNWEITAARGRTLEALRWLRERGIAVRGHNLVWPSWKFLPRDLQALKDQPQKLRQRINQHIRDEASAVRGQLVEWDVINEPYDNHDLMDILGEQEMAQWFKLTRECDPEAKLYLNDYSILAAGGLDQRHQDHFYNTARRLIDQGAPLGGLGMQSHFGVRATPPQRMLEILDRFAGLGLDLQSTELDINSTDEEMQAQFLRDFMTTLFSHQAVKGIVMWGFWEGAHWLPNAALFRRDWSARPVGKAWEDLVLKQWWTNADGRTDAQGRYQIRGFLGEYEVQVSQNGKTQTVRATLSHEGTSVPIRWEQP